VKVLVAVDDDERFESVLGFVGERLALGGEGRADEVVITHVVKSPRWTLTPPEVFERVEDFLERTASRFRRPGVTAGTLRLEGDVVRELLQAATERDVDVIVLGAFGQARTVDFLVGSVAEKLDALANRDVVLVRDENAGAELRALLAVDGSKASLAAVRSFAHRIRCERAAVRAVHVFDVLPGISVPPLYRERADRALRDASKILDERGVRAETVTRMGPVTSGVLAEAKDFEANLIVVGAGGDGSLKSFGTVRKRIARHAPCSVLVSGHEATAEET
jgi:nucleotide-binding universal stress UspA family protein